MERYFIGKRFILSLFCCLFCFSIFAQDKFPDGTIIPEWFHKNEITPVDQLGKCYKITDYGVKSDSTVLQTEQIQAVIDKVAADGGGVIYIPQGTYLTASLFFKPKTHLYLEKNAVLKGSDNITDYAIIDTRMEGQSIKYIAGLINAIGVNGFTISGEGTINGNGMLYWKAFWQRREINPKCTNLEALRPRLVNITNSDDVQLSGVKFLNSGFWTTHLYHCRRVKLIGLYIFAPLEPVKAPSTDAVDIDYCKDVLIKNCYVSVNDDGIVLKGGKGPSADKDSTDGPNENVIIEDCKYGFCHSALTCGSESVLDHNIVLRNSIVDGVRSVLWLKLRPDTPQTYEYITVDNIKGTAGNFISVHPWMQFFDLKGRKDMPVSYCKHVTMSNCNVKCEKFFSVEPSPKYKLSDFTFEHLNIKADGDTEFNSGIIKGLTVNDVIINGKVIK